MGAVELTTAERRALQLICTPGGKLAVLAVDQRVDLAVLLENGDVADSERLLEVKRDIVEVLAPDASAVLLDPAIGLPALVDAGSVPRDVGLLVALERDDPPFVDGLRPSSADPDVGAAGVRRLGGTAAKLHVFVRPDREDLDGHTAGVVRSVLEDCRRADVLCVVEALTFGLPGEDDQALERAKPALVRDCAVFLEACGAKLLKLEYPGSETACRAVTDAVGVPWAVLSAGVGHDEFVRRLRHALDGGAIGFIAGRSVWKQAAALPGASERRAALEDEGRRRFEELLATLDSAGRSALEAAV
jgi:tagatose 1,6-diphosphate aldolase